MAYQSFLLFCKTLSICTATSLLDPDMKTYTDLDLPETHLHLLAVHKDTGDVYVASLDNLYHLNADLVLKKKVATGPERACKTPGTICDNMTLTHNDPRVLLLVYHMKPHYLMLCGSLYDGMCQLRPLHDLDHVFWVGPYNDPVGLSVNRSGDPNFFGPGFGNKTVYYSGFDWVSEQHAVDLPFFSSKVLERENGQFRFKYTYKSDSSISAIFFKFDHSQILFYSFTHGPYVYFLYLRLFVVGNEVYTVLARMCIEDGTFTSYVELRLGCESNTDANPNLKADQAYFGPGFKNGEPAQTLYVIYVNESKMICDFKISEVDDLMDSSVKDCFQNGNSSYRLNIDTGGLHECSRKNGSEDADFCGSSVNPHIFSKTILISKPILNVKDDFPINAFAVFEENKRIVGFLGSKNSRIVKVLLDVPPGTNNPMLKHYLIYAEKYRRVKRQTAFDLNQEHIYFLIDNQIVKFPIRSCSIYKTCSECFQASLDPLECGWCNGKCVKRQKCPEEFFSRSNCTPSIGSVTPLVGPTQGGTHVSIFGKHFGTHGPSTLNSVSINNVACSILFWDMERIICVTEASPEEAVAPVVVSVTDDSNKTLGFIYAGVAKSNGSFLYVTPKLTDIIPDRGSVAGGTNVTIFGNHLDIGKVYIMNIRGRVCTNLKVQKFFATCVTGTTSTLKDVIELKMDAINLIPEHSVSNPSKVFQYLKDPEIYEIRPTATVFSFSGNITVSGLNLNNANDPLMFVSLNSSEGKERTFNQNCVHKAGSNGEAMLCPGPVLNRNDFKFPENGQPLIAQVSFSMFPFKENFPKPELLFYPDPEFQDTQTVALNQTSLEIKGKYPVFDSLASVIKVRIGENKPCSIYELTSDVLHCDFDPDILIKPANLSVKVFTGSNIYHVGHLLIKGHKEEPLETNIGSWFILLGILIVVSVQVCAVIYAWWWWCRKPKSPKQPTQIDPSVLFNKDPVRTENTPSHSSPDDITIRQPLVNDYSAESWPTAISRLPTESGTTPTEEISGNTASAQPLIPPFSSQLSSIPTIRDMGNASPTDISEAIPNPGYFETIPNSTSDGPVASTVSPPDHDYLEDEEEEKTISLDETLRILAHEGKIIPSGVTLIEIIGTGQFGCVYKGVYTSAEQGRKEVAVKTILGYPDQTTVKDFLDEAYKMKNFEHEHVLPLIGVYFQDNLPLIVLPYMENGNLLSYLRNEDNHILKTDLLRFGAEAAAGMTYLAQQKFVHRDIAARNLVLSSDKKVKIADFGLSRDINEEEIYVTQTSRPIPYKWMAPECIEFRVFNVKSDVWSYGVLLWEIMTRGVMPYEKIHNLKVVDYLKANKRLPRPQHCSESLYEVMMRCWEYDPSKRPSFEILHAVVKQRWKASLSQDRRQSVIARNRVYCNVK